MGKLEKRIANLERKLAHWLWLWRWQLLGKTFYSFC